MGGLAKQLALFGTAAGGVFVGLNLLIVAGAVLLGLVVGAIPGLTGTMALALLINLTYKLPSDQAVAFMLGVYVGAVSGGLFSAIMLNIPGTPNAAATGTTTAAAAAATAADILFMTQLSSPVRQIKTKPSQRERPACSQAGRRRRTVHTFPWRATGVRPCRTASAALSRA